MINVAYALVAILLHDIFHSAHDVPAHKREADVQATMSVSITCIQGIMV